MNRFDLLGDFHTKAQRDYSYELYSDKTMGVEVHDDCISVNEFKRKNPPVVIPPARSKVYAFNYTVEYPAASQNYCPVTPDPTKRFILSLITGVQRVMDDGICYAPFTSTNVVVTPEGHALFRHLEMVKLTNGAKQDAYKSVVNVIEELFKNFVIPEDIQHLISLLKSGQKEALYKIHPSLLPHTDRGWAYLKAFEYVMHRADGVARNLIFLALPYLSTWRSTMNLNLVLQETYTFASDSYKEEPPLDNNGNPTWSENEKNLQSAERFLNNIRNGTSHRLQRTFRITADQYETILLVHFQMLLPRLIELIFDHLGVEGLKAAGLLR